MAVLQFTVWETAAEVANGPVLHEDTIAIGGTTTEATNGIDYNNQGNSLIGQKRVRIIVDTASYVNWGDPAGGTVQAVNDGSQGRMMYPGNPEYFDIPKGWKIAVVQKP